MTGVRFERMGSDDLDRVLAAAELFDAPPTHDHTRRFLAEAGHHLIVAFEGEEAVGFVSGVEVAHPDKPVEMFLNELGVRDASQGRGIGRALVEALRDLAVDRGCAAMWVLTDADNAAALRTYRSAGADLPAEQVMLEWMLRGEA
ncbi:MAG: N-acetyltransferase family protein [Dehalococcoidia bacterium]